jgi:hypothetical protein
MCACNLVATLYFEVGGFSFLNLYLKNSEKISFVKKLPFLPFHECFMENFKKITISVIFRAI